MDYEHRTIERRWQATWEEQGLYRSEVDWLRPKHYALTMLPYPSGDLHMGHWYAMTPSDARARYMRMKGYNVLFPMGFDSFGLPAKNFAIGPETPRSKSRHLVHRSTCSTSRARSSRSSATLASAPNGDPASAISTTTRGRSG